MGLKLSAIWPAFALCVFTAQAPAASASTASFAPAAGRHAAELEALKKMSDSQFQQILLEDWPHVQQILSTYAGPDLALFTGSLSFSGVRDTCLRRHLVLPCRIYINDLIRFYQAHAQDAKSNPFFPVRQ